ncbi:hypothetical protein [Hyalangium versicolor]|uniref:hypothetical protein n=1 Tax=Hyalangium versicolor TaxID=2861190 RepID=UPI001CCB2343|nr:hypothetical protein [Hyalangium versicolor]
MLLARLALLAALLPTAALAQREASREALSRLEETLALRLEGGGFSTKDLLPAVVVSVNPAFEETRTWYPTEALATLARVFGAGGLRSCEACMAPRTYVENGMLEQVTTSLGTAEITRLDEANRGSSAPARTAIWLDETTEGVSLRIIELRNSRIVLAENFDASMTGPARTRRNLALVRELDRRSRGDSITHAFFDVTMYPGQHVSLDWVEQWGDTNANLSGFTLSLYDPVLGVGGAYYRVIPSALNITVGGKLLMSLPTGLIQGISGEDVDVVDPLMTAVFMLRVPIARSNYGVTFSASTNGRVGVGFSLMNVSLLPFLP